MAHWYPMKIGCRLKPIFNKNHFRYQRHNPGGSGGSTGGGSGGVGGGVSSSSVNASSDLDDTEPYQYVGTIQDPLVQQEIDYAAANLQQTVIPSDIEPTLPGIETSPWETAGSIPPRIRRGGGGGGGIGGNEGISPTNIQPNFIPTCTFCGPAPGGGQFPTAPPPTESINLGFGQGERPYYLGISGEGFEDIGVEDIFLKPKRPRVFMGHGGGSIPELKGRETKVKGGFGEPLEASEERAEAKAQGNFIDDFFELINKLLGG